MASTLSDSDWENCKKEMAEKVMAQSLLRDKLSILVPPTTEVFDYTKGWLCGCYCLSLPNDDNLLKEFYKNNSHHGCPTIGMIRAAMKKKSDDRIHLF